MGRVKREREQTALLERWKDTLEGTPVTVTKDDGSKFETVTRSPPWLVGGAAVMMVKGIAGGYSLERFELRDPSPPGSTPTDRCRVCHQVGWHKMGCDNNRGPAPRFPEKFARTLGVMLAATEPPEGERCDVCADCLATSKLGRDRPGVPPIYLCEACRDGDADHECEFPAPVEGEPPPVKP